MGRMDTSGPACRWGTIQWLTAVRRGSLSNNLPSLYRRRLTSNHSSMPKKLRKTKLKQEEMFLEVPDNAILHMELCSAKENFEKISQQFDALRVMYEDLKLQNEYLRRQLELD
jgi:hypothetical protein